MIILTRSFCYRKVIRPCQVPGTLWGDSDGLGEIVRPFPAFLDQNRRTRTLLPTDLTAVDGIDTTRAARALLDVDPSRGVGDVVGLVIDALRDGHTTRTELLELYEHLGPRAPGRTRLGRVLAALGGSFSDSTTEHDVRVELTRLGYPVHPGPFPYRCDDGVVVRLDLALPRHWVYLECDGFGAHTRKHVFETDRVKWTQVVRRWRPVWVTADRWRQDRRGVLHDLDEAIRLADPARGPAAPAT